uniref:Pre-mRNA processing factor 38B n=2 Tax=Sus scrofa TaxID=9823 RepID=A0A4X1TGW9_PIG
MANNSPALTGNSQPQHQAAAAAAQQQQQCGGGGGGGATKPAVSGKQGNVLPLWGNEKTMNLNPMILTNILSSPYFKVQLYELKTYHEVVDEIYFKVTHVEPWEKGSRKTAGQTGMCGGVRGVGTGGIVSTAFCLLYKLFTLKLTRKQVMGLITHTDSPYIRALGFMYIRYTQPPTDLWDWFESFLDDEEDLDVKAGGGCVMTIGEMLRSFLTKLEWFSTLFPRIPVPVQKNIDQQIKTRPRKIKKDGKEGAEEIDRHVERRRSRSPRRSLSPRRSPRRSRSRSHHRKSVVWQKIKATVFDDCKKEDEWKIMLLDEFTTKLLASCCKMTDLLAEGITVVENIYKNREPVRQMKALYFITPTSKSVDCFLRDFGSKSENKYKAAYIYFTDFCPDSLFNKIKASCSKSIRRCKEINISFLPLESQVYTLDVPDAFYYCYSPDPSNANGKDAIMEAMADQIVTVCATLDENPGVRYKSKPLDNASKLAQLVEKKLENYYKIDEKSLIKGKTHSQLIIIDRGFDPVSTVLHELTFQAMAYDLLPIENDTYKYKTDGKEKEAILEEDDDLWVRIRHRHIAVVLEEIPKLMKEISSTKKATEGKTSLSALAQLMKKMPHFRKQITKQVVHLNLAEDCMNKFKPNIEKLCKTEQDLALGTDAEGQKVKDSMRVLLPVLLNKNHDTYDKIRAILLYIFSINGTTEENLDRLIQNVKIENESDMIRNWSYLGVPIVPPSQQGKPLRKDRSAEETFQLSRWTPFIKDILEDAIENRLDSKEWPYCSQCPAVWNGSGAVSARQKPRANYLEDRKNGSKLIVFVIGGITYSEMRCAYEVSQAHKSCEVIIGSTHILTPKKLLDDIKMLNKPKDKVSFIKDGE